LTAIELLLNIKINFEILDSVEETFSFSSLPTYPSTCGYGRQVKKSRCALMSRGLSTQKNWADWEGHI